MIAAPCDDKFDVDEMKLQQQYGGVDSVHQAITLLQRCAEQCQGSSHASHVGSSDTFFQCHLALAGMHMEQRQYSSAEQTCEQIISKHTLLTTEQRLQLLSLQAESMEAQGRLVEADALWGIIEQL